jgi:hypothetical protein
MVRPPNLVVVVETMRVCLISFSRILDFHREDEEDIARAAGRRVGC